MILDLVLVLALAVAGASCDIDSSVDASVQANLNFIDGVLTKLNDRTECNLPSYVEINEVQAAFRDIEDRFKESSSGFDATLSADMKLLLRTMLDQWDSFDKHMNSNVVIRAAKRRSFLGRVERYQLAKHGESVCIRFKDVRGPVTDKIFEKNPIVRYVKHLQTGDVIERPDDADNDEEPSTTTDSPAEEITTTEVIPVQEIPKTVGEEAGDVKAVTMAPEKDDGGENSSAASVTLDSTNDLAPVTIAPRTENEYKDPKAGLKPGDRYLDEDGSPKVFLGQLVVTPQDSSNTKIMIQVDQVDFDPLESIPVPASDASGTEKLKKSYKEDYEMSTTTPQPSIKSNPDLTSTMPSTDAPEELNTELPEELTTKEAELITTTEEPLYDELGAAFVPIEEDDEDLKRVVRLPKKDWEFDQVFGYFKWPDESSQEIEPVRLDQTVRHMWADFLADPYSFDQYMDSLKTTTPRPKMNGSAARRKKQEFLDSVAREQRQGATFGWTFENSTPTMLGALKMPPVPKDRWTKLLDNKVCKVGYNKDEIRRKAKGSYNSVKNFFNKRRNQEEPEFD